jgi:hypothetical protein
MAFGELHERLDRLELENRYRAHLKKILAGKRAPIHVVVASLYHRGI